VGGPDGDPAAELSIIDQVLAIGDDSVYVVDEKNESVLLFDARGRLMRRLGRRGAGPGEFGYGPGRIGRLGDTIWANDLRQRRANYFGTAGRPVATRPLPIRTVQINPNTRVSVTPTGRLAGGRMVAFLPMAFTEPRRANTPVAPPHGQVGPLAIIDTAGDVTQTLSVIVQASQEFVTEVGTSIFFPGQNYFADTPLWTVASDGSGVVLVDRVVGAPRYRVTRWDARGTRLFAVDVPYQPIPMPRSVVDSVIREFQVDMKQGGATFDIPKLLRDSLHAPTTYVPVSDVIVGTDGSAWIARERRIVGPTIPLRYDIIDAKGRLIGSLTLPHPGKIAAATSHVIWIIEKDADDVPMIVRYPVHRR
jgi:hypothetical protein